MPHQSCLPPELWLQVFNWATSYPDAFSSDYKPFCTECCDPQATDLSLKVRCTLALVCRQWHALSTEFLYRDVRIGPGQSALKGALCDHDDEVGCRKYVRRAVLPFQYTSTPCYSPNPLPSVEILKLCNNLEVLIRPQTPPSAKAPRFEFDIDCLPLPCLKRLEWNYNSEAERTGGINSLGATLQNAPNLEYLSISSVSPRSQIMIARRISLPHLATLDISAATGPLVSTISYQWSLPMLSHLVLGSVYVPDLSCLWEKYGEQLEVLELGKHASFLVRDVISSALTMCSGIEELNYHVFYTLPPTLNDQHESITSIGLHSAPNLIFPEEAMWALLEKHFSVLLTDAFPSLNVIHLFGDWSQIIMHPRFQPLSKKLRQRGCDVTVSSSF